MKTLFVNTQTGIKEIVEVDDINIEETIIPKGLNLEKLKDVLLAKGIIADRSEVE